MLFSLCYGLKSGNKYNSVEGLGRLLYAPLTCFKPQTIRSKILSLYKKDWVLDCYMHILLVSSLGTRLLYAPLTSFKSKILSLYKKSIKKSIQTYQKEQLGGHTKCFYSLNRGLSIKCKATAWC